jgi:hypothetical protein
MFNHTFNGLTYSDTSSSSSSSSPNSFPQSPIRPSSAQFFHQPPAPDVPSTFLPSYYPEGRYASLDRDLNLSGNGTGYPSPNHSPATWEALSQAGPSSRHLLDGTNIIEPHPPHARGKGVGREMRPPEYRISPVSIASSLINKAATTGSGSASTSFPMDPALQSQSNSASGSGNPHSNDSGGGGGGSGVGRYHPYSHPVQRSSSGSGGGGSGPSRNNTTIPDPSTNSNAYPGNMYTNIPLPERPDLESWERMGASVEITGEDYAQVSSFTTAQVQSDFQGTRDLSTPTRSRTQYEGSKRLPPTSRWTAIRTSPRPSFGWSLVPHRTSTESNPTTGQSASTQPRTIIRPTQSQFILKFQ